MSEKINMIECECVYEQECKYEYGIKVRYRRCYKKTSYVSNYAFFTLLHKWVDRGQMRRFQKTPIIHF